MTIYPSILTDSLELAQHQLDLVAGKVPGVQLDIIDGQFTDNVTMTPIDVKELNTHNMPIDVHLMTVDPINDVAECEAIPNLRAVVAQVERMASQKEFVDHVQSFGWKAGLSLDLYTPISAIDPTLFEKLAVVQLISIKIGFQGEEFHESVLPKIRELRKVLDQQHPTCELVVDGGIQPEIATRCKAAGATGFAVGSDLWRSSNIQAALASFDAA